MNFNFQSPSIRWYILRDQDVVLADDLEDYTRWYALNPDASYLWQEQITDGIRVSTVFLGLDHSLGTGALPVVFETMVFGGPMSGDMQRWTNYQDAKDGHEAMVSDVRAAMVRPPQ